MTTNQTIDGVPRELLQRFAKYLDDGLHLSREEREILDELRALLDAPVECRCKRYGKSNPHWPCPVHTESAQEQALDELRALLDAPVHPCPVQLDGCDGSCVPAAQGQGEPVAWLIQCQYSGLVEQAEPNDKSDRPEEWSDSFPVYRRYAEQPAPVAVVQTCCGSCPGGCPIGAKP